MAPSLARFLARLSAGVATLLIALAQPVIGAHAAAPRLVREVSMMRPVPHITAIAQVGGFVWLGAPNGLLRADGLSVVRIPEEMRPKPGGWGVVHLAPGRGGLLWVLTRQAPRQVDVPEGRLRERLSAFDTLAMRVVETTEPFTHTTSGLCETEDGRLWVASHLGVFNLNRQSRELERAPPFARLVRASALVCEGDRVVVAGEGQVLSYDGRATRSLAAPAGVTSLALTKEAIVAGTAAGAFVLTEGGPQRLDDAAEVTHVRALAKDASGTLWLGTDAGVHALEAGGLRRFAEDDGLNDGRVTTLMGDDEGGMWVGTRAGGAALIRHPLLANVEAPGPDVRAVLTDATGALWASSARGLARRDPAAPPGTPSSGWRLFEVGEALPAAPGSLASGGPWLWATTESQGLIVGGVDGFSALGTAQGLPRADPRFLHIDGAGRLWVGFADGSVSTFRPAVGDGGRPVLELLATASPSGGLCGGTLRAFAEAPDGTLFLGSDDGVTEVPGGRLDEARCVRGGEEATGVTGLWHEGGQLWVARAFDQGLTRLRGGPPLRLAAGVLYCDSIQRVLDVPGPFLWSSCSAGIGLLDKRLMASARPDGGWDLPAIGFDLEDGLRSEEGRVGFNPGLSQDHDGHVWVVTQLGLVVFDDLNVHRARLRLRPVIESISLDGELQEAAENRFEASVGRGVLEIKFAVPSFVWPSLIRARYRLVGIDDRWRHVRGARTIRYERLPAGAYTFELQATDGLGRWSERLVRSVILTPPFHRTWAFAVLCALGLALLILGVHKARLRRIVSRYQAVHEERQRIARDLHDGVAQAFTGIGLQLDALAEAPETDTPRMRNIIRQAKAMVEGSREEARRTIWNLRERAALPLSVHERLKQAARTGLAGAGKQVKVRIEAAEERALAAAMEEHELTFIVQEAVTNAAKHGGARSITIRCLAEGDELLLSVEDDGVGISEHAIDRAAKTGHFGIMGMRERARRLGGELSIRPRKAGGTQVLLLLPRAQRSAHTR